MKKDYREYTIGELLDAGFDISLKIHIFKEGEEQKAKQHLEMFNGLDSKVDQLNDTCNTVEIEEERFEVISFCSRFN